MKYQVLIGCNLRDRDGRDLRCEPGEQITLAEAAPAWLIDQGALAPVDANVHDGPRRVRRRKEEV